MIQRLKRGNQLKLLEVKNLSKSYDLNNHRLGKSGRLEAIKNISFSLEAGKTLAIVGESGSGKSTLARQVIGIEKQTDGIINFNGVLQNSSNRKQRKERFRKIRMIFQNPYGSLNPQARVGETLEEALQINTQLSQKERRQKVSKTLTQVGLMPEHQYRYPHMFSGGQRQRIAIARAIILDPEIVIADEPLSALDVSIQAQILNLMQELQEELEISYLFISHDLNIVEHIADNVMVMYRGEVVEYGSVDQIFDSPKHPYTQALFASTPMYRQRFPDFSIPKPSKTTNTNNVGCKFSGRCDFCTEKCMTNKPPKVILENSHEVACFKV